LVIVWTSSAPFIDAGVGERGAWAFTAEGKPAVKQAMSTRPISFGRNRVTQRVINKVADPICDIGFFSLISGTNLRADGRPRLLLFGSNHLNTVALLRLP
jgi:hypothetical protein